MKFKNKILFFTLFLITIIIVYPILMGGKTSVSKDLYDDWYESQPTWFNENHLVKDGYENIDFESRGRAYAWGWSYIGNSLVDMYRATGDKKYLDFFIPKAEYILTQTDENLGIESFTDSGLSLPVWSDDGFYSSSKKFSYTYPVHTAMITLPMLRFIDSVREDNLVEYIHVSEQILLEVGRALEVHNDASMWVDINANEGFYKGHPYGEGEVNEANKIGIPNRISVYLAAAGLYDKLTDHDDYTNKINKSLNYLKNTLFEYDETYDAYYWSYWEDLEGTPWEDISHAALTAYGIFLLHNEVGFEIFSKSDFRKMANIINKIIDNNSPPKVRRFIHKREDEEAEYYTINENDYYQHGLRWSFLGIYDKKIFNKMDKLFGEVFEDVENPNEDTIQTRLAVVAMLLNAKEQAQESCVK